MVKTGYRRKKGSETLEAAIVIPIFILIVYSLISLTIFYYSSIKTQTSLHNELVDMSNESNNVFDIIRQHEETSKKTGGISGIVLKRKIEGRIYSMDQGEMVRLGGIFEFGEE